MEFVFQCNLLLTLVELLMLPGAASQVPDKYLHFTLSQTGSEPVTREGRPVSLEFFLVY